MPELRPGIISQARMTSTRLPGKVLMKIGGKTLLEYHIERLRRSKLPIIVATTTNQTDDPIVNLCEALKVPTYRGDENDVLSRFWGACEKFDFDPVVRVTSDCPLIDGQLIGKSMQEYLSSQKTWTYASNCLERTYPRGFDFEIFSRAMLGEANQKGLSQTEREHVTPYFYLNRHGQTRFETIKREPSFQHYRLTVDEPDDFRLIEKLILEYSSDQKNENEIIEVLKAHPELLQINSHIEQKKL